MWDNFLVPASAGHVSVSVFMSRVAETPQQPPTGIYLSFGGWCLSTFIKPVLGKHFCFFFSLQLFRLLLKTKTTYRNKTT